MEEKVLITHIQRFAVNDGPGFRTIVFLKGCPLSCAWCHNPETKAPYPEIYWKRRLCVQCGRCMDVCPEQAVSPPAPPQEAMADDSRYRKLDRSRCTRCMKCVQACAFGALEIAGRPMGIDEIIHEVQRDRTFYGNSGGGMTVSGGEPAMHGAFTMELLGAARGKGIHTCVDTSGYGDITILQALADASDTVLFDLKHLDGVKHRAFTGKCNDVILGNLSILSRSGRDIRVRIPVVPGFNDSPEFHREASIFLSSLPGRVSRVDLLAFHNWCQDKYTWLGLDWKYREVESLDPSFLEAPAGFYRERGLKVTIGGSGFSEEVSGAFLSGTGQEVSGGEGRKDGGTHVKKGPVEQDKGKHV